jgi:hypothetical protein
MSTPVIARGFGDHMISNIKPTIPILGRSDARADARRVVEVDDGVGLASALR